MGKNAAKTLAKRARTVVFSIPFSSHLRASPFPPRGVGSPYDGLYGAAPPERGILFRLQAYEREGISLAEVYKRVGKSVIWFCERDQKGKQMNFMAL